MSGQESSHINRFVGWGIIGLIVVIVISIAIFFCFPTKPGGFNYPFFLFHFGWLGGIFLLFMIFWIAKWFFWPKRGEWYRYEPRSAESILKERYAKGEITKEQFEAYDARSKKTIANIFLFLDFAYFESKPQVAKLRLMGLHGLR